MTVDAAQAQRRAALGKLLREARQSRGWVLEQVAKKAGVSVPFLSDLERGKRVIGPARLYALTVALELPDADYVRVFQLRQRLPPKEEKWLLRNPGAWQSRLKKALPSE